MGTVVVEDPEIRSAICHYMKGAMTLKPLRARLNDIDSIIKTLGLPKAPLYDFNVEVKEENGTVTATLEIILAKYKVVVTATPYPECEKVTYTIIAPAKHVYRIIGGEGIELQLIDIPTSSDILEVEEKKE